MPKTRNFRYYDLFVAASVATLIISNLGAMKLVAFGPIIADGGAILFPLAYILGDVMTEVYGYKHTRRAIWVSFTWLIIMIGVLTIVQHMPAVEGAPNVSEFDSVFGFVPRIVLASLTAYLVGEFLNSFVLAKMKVRSRGKHLWQRLVTSTVLGEAVVVHRDVVDVVEVQAGPGVRDAGCGALTYDGHDGTDFALPTTACLLYTSPSPRD